MTGPSRRGLLLLLVLVYDVAVAFNSPSWALQQRQPVESRRNNALHGGTATEEELDLETERVSEEFVLATKRHELAEREQECVEFMDRAETVSMMQAVLASWRGHTNPAGRTARRCTVALETTNGAPLANGAPSAKCVSQ